MSLVKKFFGVSNTIEVDGESVRGPSLNWARRGRGFRVFRNPEEVDIEEEVFGHALNDWKRKVVEEASAIQTISIYDVLNSRFRPGLMEYKKSLVNDGSYYAQHPELFRPDRIIALDGVVQSRFFGEAAYHEALVHPAMLSHPNPKRVAIIGGMTEMIPLASEYLLVHCMD